ncbi:MAG TPA: carbamoylsarcosine amidase [Planctomycetaceae bacterium]|jgi:maleamate amidohydrolase|nr:carbamoylsarcosine amidase [Rhodopirellula sp.]MCH2362563.1 isochorismatase family protein [Pirellulales bacterium]HAL14824.1 carbamoylsarcosine amidase [Planctomycetaceae bacterium]HCK70344.1 carbamoylsarcosine amidase [Planctomycetaceae bacterium]HCP84579.1 carbamoylsarcosine amidase [Planctomycetaceae bacterium]|tara:strand:+ start:692 stop:1366 length:675 start_codon:yes stop_codon:yes gene_type:complete
MYHTDEQAQALMAEAIDQMNQYYVDRGIFQGKFGYGTRPAVIVVDFALGWTDESYAGGTARLDSPVENTARLIAVARQKDIPIVYTTSPYRPEGADQPFKSAADESSKYREWDARAVEIDERVAPSAPDLVIEKENASAFFGTHLIGYLTQLKVDTVLITGCSTSACIRATATDAKSYRLKPVIVSDCVGDRSAAAHVFTLADIQARFADVVSLDDSLEYVESL